LQLIINTPLGARATRWPHDAHGCRAAQRAAAATLSAASAAINGIAALKAKALKVRSLQAHFKV
jgi:hypothetical protein